MQRRIEFLKVYLPGILVAVLAFSLASRWVEPAPPDRLRLAVGPEGGSYHWLGQRYQEVLAQQGLEIELVESTGSPESLDLLLAGEAEAAFVKSGVTPVEDSSLQSLASLYFEPLWVFTKESEVDDLLVLEDLQIAVGEPQSGGYFLAEKLLRGTGAMARNQLVQVGGIEAFQNGSVDVVFLIASPNNPDVRTLLETEGVELISFRRAAGFTKHYPFLSQLSLPEGSIDLAKNLPHQQTEMLAPAATLVVGEKFHPALAGVVLAAARTLHSPAGPLNQRGAFPSPDYVSFPLTHEAEFFHENGPSFFHGRLPYKTAAVLERILILLLPLVTVVLPLAKILPAIYNWRMKSKIYEPYKELLEFEGQEYDEERLDAIEAKVRSLLTMPPAYGPEVHQLLAHIHRIRR